MAISVRNIFTSLSLGLLAVICAPFFVDAQVSTAQIIVVTQNTSAVSIPAGAFVTVTGSGPSLTSTPSASNTLSYNSTFVNDTRIVTVIPGSYSVVAGGTNSSLSYTSSCTGILVQGEVRTCTITANSTNGGGNARVNVSVNVINDNGGTRTPNDFVITVSGQNTTVSNFQASVGSVQISLGAGAYSIDASSVGSYTVNRSGDCSGTISSGETRSCAITLNDVGSNNCNVYPYNNCYYPPANTQLTCSPAVQAVRLGSTASFVANGGGGAYNWVTSDRTYLNVGPQLNVVLSTVGRQTVYVSNGYQTASCSVDVYSSGVVLGDSTKAPGLPNTGYAPNTLATVLALLGAFVAFPLAVRFAFPYAKNAALAIFG